MIERLVNHGQTDGQPWSGGLDGQPWSGGWLTMILRVVTVKTLKTGTPQKFAVNVLKVEQFGFMTE